VAFYIEYGLLEESPKEEGHFHRAVAQQRGSRCLYWERRVAEVSSDAPSDVQPLASGTASADVAMLLHGQIDGLTGSLEWSQPQRTDLMPVSQIRREQCELAIFADLQLSIDRDVHLLEPYKLDQPVSEVSSALNRVDRP
jgi:hypothetical protein